MHWSRQKLAKAASESAVFVSVKKNRLWESRKEVVSERVGDEGRGARIRWFAKPVGEGHGDWVEVFVGNEYCAAARG